MISIIMPVYNGEKFLTQSIDSILNSSFKNFELIVVNDGSTDSSESIVKSYKDKRIKIFYKENSGIGESLNFGIEKSAFEIIARMDSDDIMLPDRLEKQLTFFKKNEIEVLGSNAFIIDKDGKPITETKMPLNHSQIKKSLESFESPIIHPSVMIKKSAVISVNGYRPIHPEDYDLWLRLLSNNRFANIEDKLIHLRKHDSNISIVKNVESMNTKYKSLGKYYNYKSVDKETYFFKNYKSYFNKIEDLKGSNKPIKIFTLKIIRGIYKNLMILMIKIYQK